MQGQHLRGQVVLAHQGGEPGPDRVDLVDADVPDLAQRLLAGLEPPLGVEGEADPRPPEQLLVGLGLGEEVGAARLQVEHDVGAGPLGRLHPRQQRRDRRAARVGAVLLRRPRRHGGDQLERRHHRLLHEGGVARGQLRGPPHRLLRRLLAEHAERGGLGVAVERATIRRPGTAAGHRRAARGAARGAHPVGEPSRRAEPAPTASTAVSAAAAQGGPGVGCRARVGAGDGEPAGAHGSERGRRAAGTFAPGAPAPWPGPGAGVSGQAGQLGQVADVGRRRPPRGRRCRRAGDDATPEWDATSAARCACRAGRARPASPGPSTNSGMPSRRAAAVPAARSAGSSEVTTTTLAASSRARDAASVAAAGHPRAAGRACRPGRAGPAVTSWRWRRRASSSAAPCPVPRVVPGIPPCCVHGSDRADHGHPHDGGRGAQRGAPGEG